ncbi:hypothetical protein OHB33_41145 (plasmid) [Streptomyces sp. NBC_01558]|uniref:hypothetical protein n=1 Tax=Streptomyces sp. NBC_01558 TaxID=2975878 RepID=UPI002DDB02EB|nr:hypothetical protein [Streptomyces sp. NBC_01558]WSD82793.1 hypothetical protein OHB33_41145 [Streptomyces sp. NBC_01558]
MAIVVTRELSKNRGPGLSDPDIKAVHAVPAATDLLGLPGDWTFCGEPTADMERLDYQAAGPGELWLPPDMTRWKCSGCADALQAL